MVTIQYFENNALFFSQLVNHVPEADQDIKIKGRKGKVIRVSEMNKDLIHVHVILEKKTQKQQLTAK